MSRGFYEQDRALTGDEWTVSNITHEERIGGPSDG